MLTGFMVSRLRRTTLFVSLSVALGFLVAACQRVPLLAPTGSTITLTSSATALPINGSADIIAQVIEAAGTPPHSGTEITFTTNLGSVQPSTADTDSAGRVVVRFNAGTQSGTATITAISGGVAATGDKAIKIQIGAAAVGGITVGATPSTLPSGGGTATIAASVVDTTGNPLPFAPVTFAIDTSSNGTAGGNGTLSTTVVNTDQNGRAQTSLTTNRTTTVSATAGFSTTSGTTTTAAPIARVTRTSGRSRRSGSASRTPRSARCSSGPRPGSAPARRSISRAT